MTYPPDLTVELMVDGAWVDVTSDVRVREDVAISRGRRDEASRADAGRMSLMLNNRHGRYSPRNPTSPYYGKIGRNTPVRVRVGDIPTGTTRMSDDFDRTETGGWGTATSGQDWEVFVGDAADYTVSGGAAHVAVDATATNWLVRVLDPAIGADVGVTATVSTDTVAEGDIGGAIFAGIALRDGVTDGFYLFNVGFRVDTGAGRRVSANILVYDGSNFTELTPVVMVPGLVYDADDLLRVRIHADGGDLRMRVWADGDAEPEGVWHAQVHDTTVTAGGYVAFRPFISSEADRTSLPVTVSLHDLAVADLASDTGVVRGVWEISAWPTRWDASDADVWVPVDASGVLRRLEAGAEPLRSPLYRQITNSYPVAYWPMEDGQDATRAASTVSGVAPLITSGLEFGEDDTLDASGALPVVADGGASWSATVESPDSDAWSVSMLYRLAEDDHPPTTDAGTMLAWHTSGTAVEWRVVVFTDSGTPWITVGGFALDGSTVFTASVDVTSPGVDFWGDWRVLRLDAYQDGSDVVWRLDWINLNGDNWGTGGSYTGEVGRVTQVATSTATHGATLAGMALGHLAVWGSTSPAAYVEAGDGHDGETAATRMARLAAERDIPLLLAGDADTTLGVQRTTTALDLITAAAEADLGVLGEQRATAGLWYRDRSTLYNQTPALVLDYSNGEISPPLEPTDDDQQTVNDVTVEREDGGQYRAVQESGPLSVAAPPDGVGRYDTSVTLDVETDAQLPGQAGWRLHLGTVDEPRYPVVRVNLANPRMRSRIGDVLAVDVGDRIQITHLPAWGPPVADLIVQGYSERIGAFRWELEFVCTPASPWTVLDLPEPDTISEDFEDTDLAVTVTDGGDAPWERDATWSHTGTYSLRSGAISHSETSDAVVTVPSGATELEFWWQVSSEEDFDFFRVLVDATQVMEESGGGDQWQRATVDVADASTVTFRYAKDGSVSEGDDLARVDDLVFTLDTTTVAPDDPVRVDTAGSALETAVSASETTLSVATTDGPVWADSATYPDEFPFDIHVGGEVMRVTAITGTSSPQQFTVQRSTNGIQKSHDAGSDVRLAYPAIVAL